MARSIATVQVEERRRWVEQIRASGPQATEMADIERIETVAAASD
jgi:hypothetical protein